MKAQQKPSKRIKKGDKVIVIAGNYRTMQGTVISTDGLSATVEGINIRKRHVKRQGDTPGRIVQREYPINVSNLQPCTEEGKRVKLHVRTNEEGARQLYYTDGDQEILYRAIKKS